MADQARPAGVLEQERRRSKGQKLPAAGRASAMRSRRLGRDRYVGRDGAIIGVHTFGSSAPLKDLLTKFAFTPERVMEAAKAEMARSKRK